LAARRHDEHVVADPILPKIRLSPTNIRVADDEDVDADGLVNEGKLRRNSPRAFE
jgi:hypothetical protein|tara:strand:+ start:2114 stop:2278 length:165 start_codon:yes stop_codon:yes gene_type:complete